VAEKESSLGYLFLELFPGIDLADIVIAELESLCVDVVLNLVKKRCNHVCNTFLRVRSLLAGITACKLHSTVLEVTSTHCKTYRNTLELPLCELESRTESVTAVDLDSDALRLEFLLECCHLVEDGIVHSLILSCDRNHHHLDRSELRRKHETVVVSVSHDEGSHKTGRNAP